MSAGAPDFHTVRNQDSRDYCVIAAYNTGAGNVTRAFAANRQEALTTIRRLDAPAVYDRLRTSLPHEETRRYVVRVTGYRKQLVNLAPAPAGAIP